MRVALSIVHHCVDGDSRMEHRFERSIEKVEKLADIWWPVFRCEVWITLIFAAIIKKSLKGNKNYAFFWDNSLGRHLASNEEKR